MSYKIYVRCIFAYQESFLNRIAVRKKEREREGRGIERERECEGIGIKQ